MEKTFFARTFFKKALPFILACFLTIGLCACGDDGNVDVFDGTTGDNATDSGGSDNVHNGGSDNTDGEQSYAETFFLNSPALDIRVLGEREYRDGISISCNYPGSGFEGKLKSNGGAVTVKLKADGECSFLVYVDGELRKTADGKDYFTATDGALDIGELAEGERTLRVIRASGYGVEVELYAIALSGSVSAYESADEDRTFIEFIGDSINSTVGGEAFTENVGLTYSYLIAEKMGADYSITSYGDNGLIGKRNTADVLYGSEEGGDFTRKADIAVINVGALDSESEDVDMGELVSRYEALAKKVKELNGASCKLLIICTSGDDGLKDAVSVVCSSLGGANNGYFFKALTASDSVPHTEAEHASYVSEIMAAIEEVDSFEIQPIKVEQSGTGSSVSIDSARWGTL